MRAVAVVGGGANYGSGCGFYVYLSDSVSSADWNIAPGISY